ncbi:MAG: DUF2842 domain-containing protein [Rhodospirillales bacterium]|nr:DUF2842 domain-containing protein [Rhodospirillales bacterium]MDE2201004.1 DUF2842 domain-containing protein [Rhodospirillales bacterium]MDE2574373.1 DUF2842 domain-containing protein [Rhodospirillales bacterium]
MWRPLIATLAGLAGFIAYIAGAVTLADRVGGLPWPVQAGYFVVAGVLWVAPAHLLMLWAARK